MTSEGALSLEQILPNVGYVWGMILGSLKTF